MENSVEEAAVRKSLRVSASIERAFSVFVEQMETWWPKSHHIGAQEWDLIVIEPRVGGRWYEQDSAGRQCDWGTVVALNPPHNARLTWHIGPRLDSDEWGYDPDLAHASEVEIRFTADGHMTLVELEHSKLERHGIGAEKLRAIFDGPGAWGEILEQYVHVANEKEAK
jgi:uncharacterized protein YndB with AHSA1/START domain